VIPKDTRILFSLSILMLAWPSGLASQSCDSIVSCGSYSQWDPSCLPTPPVTAYNWHTVGPFTANALAKSAACAPFPECPTCNRAGRPIDLSTGDTYITQNDVRVPGLGGGLALTRTWNSIGFDGVPGLGIFGLGWTSNFEERVFVDPDGYVKYKRADGGIWSFGFSGWDNGNPFFAVAGPATQNARLTQIPKGWMLVDRWTLSFENGEQRAFDGKSGNLLSISDRNGNTTTLEYDSSFRLITVIDSASRHLLFSYANPLSYLVTSVTSDFGVSLSYAYDAQMRLVQVTEPDNTTVSFQYTDSNPNLITSVLDSGGRVLESHTYNTCGQGLTSSRAGGVEAVTVAYPLSCHFNAAAP